MSMIITSISKQSGFFSKMAFSNIIETVKMHIIIPYTLYKAATSRVFSKHP